MKGMGSDAVSHGYDMTNPETVIEKKDVSYADRQQSYDMTEAETVIGKKDVSYGDRQQ